MRKIISIFILVFIYFQSNGQDYIPRDTLYGKVKHIREKVIFLTDMENPQLMYYNDYGHEGFKGPKESISKFKTFWYETKYCYLVNYDRTFDENGNIIRDIWYYKDDSFLESYEMFYDKNNKLVKKVDSTEYSVYTETYYYSDYGDLNIIKQNPKSNFYSHKYKKINGDKLMQEKIYEENGAVHEYKYHYNENGQLKFRIYKSPYYWEKIDEKTHAYSLLDTVPESFKEIINYYDEQNRLVKKERFSILDNDETYDGPIRTVTDNYFYKGNNLSLLKSTDKSGMTTYKYFKYNSENKILGGYCCEKDIAESIINVKYQYKGKYVSESKVLDEGKKYNISYKYKFDFKNNWIEIVKTVNGINRYKWIREIDYFD